MADPEPLPRASPAKAAGLCALIGAGCAALVTPMIQQWEGKRNVGYYDIVHVATACYGNTKGAVVGRRYTDAECDAQLEQQLIAHAKPVLACTPRLVGHAPQLAAAVSLAYNIGPSAYCNSTVDRRFDAGAWRSACDAFLMWSKAGGKIIPGLLNRRRAERDLCLREIPA